jgi:hypothetical protein
MSNRYRGRAPTLSRDFLGLVRSATSVTVVFYATYFVCVAALIHGCLSRHRKPPRLHTSFRHCNISMSPNITPLKLRRLECVVLPYYIVEKYLDLAMFLLDASCPCRRSLIGASRLEQVLNSTLQVLPVRYPWKPLALV